MLFCSIYDRARLASARALVDSLREHHPETEIALLFVAEASPAPVADVQPMSLSALGPEAAMLVPGTPFEQRDGVLLAPLLRHLLDRSETVVYLSCEMRVLAPLDPLLGALDGADLVGVEMLSAPLPEDGLAPDEETVASYGLLNRRVLGLRRSAGADALLARWPTWSEGDPGVTPFELAAGGVQRHLDRQLIAAPGGRILASSDLAVGYWNLPVAGDGPIRLFDTTGLDARRHDGPFPNETRLRLSQDPALSKLVAGLEAQARSNPLPLTPEYGVDPAGRPLAALLRRLIRRAIGDRSLTAWLWSDEGAKQWDAWLAAPADAGGDAGITRYQLEIYRSRDDLRGAFPNLDAGDGELFAQWLSEHGAEDLDLLEDDLPAPPRPSVARSQTLPWGVNVAGFFRSGLGLGEAARLLVAALDGAQVPALPVQGRYVPPTQQHGEFTFTSPAEAPYPINVICLNGDVLPRFAREAEASFFADRHTIALWWWELVGAFPEPWKPSFANVNEIWVASQHIHDAIAPYSPVPVNRVRMPVAVPRLRPYSREQLGLPREGFVFAFVFDYHSTAARKNPVGHVEAFKRAFDEGSGAKLVIKCINAERMPSQHEQTLRAVGDHPDITVIDSFISADEKNALIASCDCYLSLHRSEGFGLTLAEAMAFGKPTIATRYGGALDFMDDTTAYLVDWTPAEVGPGANPYPADAIWAEPDLEHAAQLMRHVVENPQEARDKGRRAAEFIAAHHSPQATGALIRQRLETVWAEIADRGAERPTAPVPELASRHMLDRQTALPPPGGRGARVKRPARDAVERALSPFVDRQLAVDRSLVDDVGALRATVARSLADTGDRIDRVVQEERAQTLAALRRLRAVMEDQDRLLATVAEQQVLPYTAQPWDRFEVDGLGEVEGYRDRRDGDAARHAEERLHGSRERLLELQRPYVRLLDGHAPVLDVGCGRGELLELLREGGVDATGIDLDAEALAAARSLGLDAVQGDGVARLEDGEPGSLGAVTAMQVIEHLAPADLHRMLAAARRALRNGGRLIVETVNPHVVHASTTSSTDHIHDRPLFPDVVLTLCHRAGFESAFVTYPGGSGDLELDRRSAASYAVVAEAG